jgi:hypothetical protein
MNLPAELTAAIEDFANRRAWGQIQIDLQRGRIVLVRENETITLDSQPRENNSHAYTRNR